ncbi:MAG: hypothetical protein PHR51_00055 [Patescibacteria group bacterium]|nr:hypothetical protein [Patescibacteria group bacterium]
MAGLEFGLRPEGGHAENVSPSFEVSEIRARETEANENGDVIVQDVSGFLRESGHLDRPELLDERFALRRRYTTSMVLQLQERAYPTLVHRQEYAAAQARFAQLKADGGPIDDADVYQAFSTDVHGVDRMRTWLQDDRIQLDFWTLRMQGTETQTTYDNELSFAIDNLSPSQLAKFEEAYHQGEPIHLHLFWGTKTKFTKFPLTNEVLRHDFDDYQETKGGNGKGEKMDFRFHGSDFILFTKMHLIRDEKTKELHLVEELLTEVNLGNKVTNRRVKKGLSWRDRTLKGLGQMQETGDVVDRQELLYNQFRLLTDHLSEQDAPWVTAALLDYLERELEHRGYVPQKPFVPSFDVNAKGELIGEQRIPLDPDESALDGNGNGFHVDFEPIRINATGVLADKLMKISNLIHQRNRVEKLHRSRATIYPAFNKVMENAVDGLPDETEDLMVKATENWAKVVMGRERTIKLLFTKEGNHLKYLLFCFATDPRWDGRAEAPNLQLVRTMLTSLHLENGRIGKHSQWQRRHVRYFNENYQNKILADVEAMCQEEYFQCIDEAEIPERLVVRGPKEGGHQLRGIVKGSKTRLVRPKDESQLAKGFDVSLHPEGLAVQQAQTADMLIEYAQALAETGVAATSYTMYRDNTPRILRGRKTSGRELYNNIRTRFKQGRAEDVDKGIKPGRSSGSAMRAGFDLAKERLRAQMELEPTLEEVLPLLDYEQNTQAAQEIAHVSGEAGEIFTHLALKEAPQVLLGIDPTTPVEVIYVDHLRGQCGEGPIGQEFRRTNQAILDRIHGEFPGAERRIRPDFVLQINGTKEVFVEVKSELMGVTEQTIKSIWSKYEPYMADRQLVVVMHGDRGLVRPEAWRWASRHKIPIITEERIREALRYVSEEKYGLSARTLAETYRRFAAHPPSFAQQVSARELMHTLKSLAAREKLDEFAPLFK